MRRSFPLALTCALLAGTALGQEKSASTDTLECNIGPVTKRFGAGEWLVYACTDKKSVAIVALASNPAQPFYFFFAPNGDRYRLIGEGTGSKEATQAAFNELSVFSVDQVLRLAEEAKAAAQSTKPKK
jgi:hypothetical protein